MRDVPGAEAGLAAMREEWTDQHELVEQEYAERMAGAGAYDRKVYGSHLQCVKQI